MHEYATELFVARDKEIELVAGIIHDVLKSHRADQRTVIFVGERGIGKSWLLHHIAHDVHARFGDDVNTFAFNLKDSAEQDPTEYVAGLLSRFAKTINLPGHTGVTLADMSRALGDGLRRTRRAREAYVILADSVFESDWDLLASLEEYFLGPLAIEPHTVIVMTGRGPEYPWRTPELGTQARIRPLEPFDERETSDQIHQLTAYDKSLRVKPGDRAQIHDIYGYSRGNPLITSSLVHQPEQPAVALDTAITEMLDIVNPNERDEVRTGLEALCVLQSFREDRIPDMFQAYDPENPAYHDWSYAQSRTVRELLTRYAFATWDDARNGYVISRSPREQIELYIKLTDPARWRRLHCRAYLLYSDWTETYPRARTLWQHEADYHDHILRDAGFDPDACHETLPVASTYETRVQ